MSEQDKPQSAMMAYIAGDDQSEMALLKAQLEHMGGALSREIELSAEAQATISRLTELLGFLKEVSDALLKVRPLGGSELFVHRFGEYYADPAYCGAAIEEKDQRYHEAMKARVLAERERDALKHDISRHLSIMTEMQTERDGLRNALKPLAVLEVPKGAKYNAGTYSIRFSDIERAKQVLTPPDPDAVGGRG